MTRLDAVIVGAGQAGLALGYHLSRQGRDFVIVDGAPEIGSSWRTRWDSLTLFTPAQFSALPELAFPASEGHFPNKDEVADYLRTYAGEFHLPVRLSLPVLSIEADDTNGYRVALESETLRARNVVVATGPFQVPSKPAFAAQIAADYRADPQQ